MWPSRGTPCNISVFYISLKSTFSVLQFCRRHYGYIFICVAVVTSQGREIMRNSDKIGPYSSSTSSKLIDLGVNRKRICNFLLVITVLFSNEVKVTRYFT